MLQEQFDWSNIDEVFKARRQAKEEKSRRLAELPFEKKIEIVEKFNGILKAALREDDERRAAGQESVADKN
jgi:hypothetical protein